MAAPSRTPVEHRPVGSSYRIEYSETVGSAANWLPLATVSLLSRPFVWYDAQPAALAGNVRTGDLLRPRALKHGARFVLPTALTEESTPLHGRFRRFVPAAVDYQEIDRALVCIERRRLIALHCKAAGKRPDRRALLTANTQTP